MRSLGRSLGQSVGKLFVLFAVTRQCEKCQLGQFEARAFHKIQKIGFCHSHSCHSNRPIGSGECLGHQNLQEAFAAISETFYFPVNEGCEKREFSSLEEGRLTSVIC